MTYRSRMPYYGTLKTSGNIDHAGSYKRIRSIGYRTLDTVWLIGLTCLLVIATYIGMIIFVMWAVPRWEKTGHGQDGTGQVSEISNNLENYYPGLLGQLRLVGGIRHADGM